MIAPVITAIITAMTTASIAAMIVAMVGAMIGTTIVPVRGGADPPHVEALQGAVVDDRSRPDTCGQPPGHAAGGKGGGD